MQNFLPTTHRSREKIDSHEWNKQNRDIHADLNEAYRNVLNTNAETKIAQDMLLMVQAATSNQSRVAELDDSFTNIVNQVNSDRILFPVTSTINRRASLDLKTDLFSLYVINNDNQFAFYDTNELIFKPKPGIRVTRRLLPPASRAFDTGHKIDNIVTQGNPYIVKVPDIQEPVIEITFQVSSSVVLEANNIYLQPFPNAFGTSIEDIQLETLDGSIVEIQRVDGTFLDLSNGDQISRTKTITIPIKRTQFSRAKIKLKGLTYIEEQKSSVIGLSRMSIENITYAAESVIGFRIDMNGNRFISQLEVLAEEMSHSAENTQWLVYDNINDFNDMNNNYIAFNKSDIKVENDTAYVMVKLTKSELETTPMIQGIRYKLSE